MHIRESITYAAPVPAVLAMLADPGFHEQVTERSRPLRSAVDARAEADGGVVARVERTQSTAGLGLPAAMRLDELTLVEDQRWSAPAADGSAQGTITVQVQGLPVTFTGRLALVPEGEGCVQTLDGDLVAKVPLVGGSIEKAAAPSVLAAVRTAADTAHSWLAAR